MKNKNLLVGFMVLILVAVLFCLSVSADDSNVCCEKTTSGLFCQNVPSSQCASGARQVPTSCDSTSYCKGGTCYDSSEGTCLDNTPQIVCNANNGTWSESSPAACSPGCCVLGDQAAFVSLVRCKRLSGFLGLQTNFRKDITDEVSCINSVRNQDKGACVYESDFEKTCKFTTRADCNSQPGGNGTVASNANFFLGKLCSAEELGTNCGPTKNTVCVPGKDEVYFVDSCGNPANIYDATKINDKDYWANVKDKSQSCNPTSPNSNSASCGNCNYPLGSFCRQVTNGMAQPTFGSNVCLDLNCYKTQNGKSYKHGESWCVYNDQGGQDNSNNAVGSRFYKHICEFGQEVVEQCADYRKEVCIQGSIATTAGPFSQAACRVNRWIDCLAQTTEADCTNTDRRDCVWKPGIVLSGANSSADNPVGACVPLNTPGLQFWDDSTTATATTTVSQAASVCAQANAQCTVTFEKGLFGGEKCKDGCECIDSSWQKQRTDLCMSLGDCGPKINWIGQTGYKAGFTSTTN